MKRALFSLVALLLLLAIAGCGATPVAEVTATPEPPARDLPQPEPTLSPTDSPAPEPTATWVPTHTSLPPSATPPPALALPDDVLATMDAIEVEMEDLRGLEETTPLTRTLMTRQELADYLQRELEEEYPPEEIEKDVRVLAAFDFVAEDFDLKRVILDLYSTQVLGMYEDEEDTFYIITDDEFDLMDRLTFAHEYTHGLQDQHYGLDLFVDEDRLNDDQVLARLSLVEGDATLAMTEYLYAHLSELSAEDLAELQSEEIDGSAEALAAAPPIIRETLDFPYVYGLEFVMTIQEGGWEAVDNAFADPPQSTEQILHPEKYLTRDEPQIVALPPLTDTLGAGWRLLEAETLGEFQTGLYLEQQVAEATADLASQGWDGDLYAVYARGDEDLLVFATVWDRAMDRDEFVFAYTQYAKAKYGQPASRTGEAEAWWETPSQTTVLDWAGPAVLVVVGPDPETVARVLDEIKLHEETA